MSDSEQAKSYVLARGHVDSLRLNLAHFFWKKNYPYLVHPSVQLKDRPDLGIADVGCGTGIWLLEVSEEYPDAARLDGFDLALHQSPSKAMLPSNVDFKFLDIHKEIPDEYVGKYDFVNVRFMIGLVNDQDPIPLLQNLLKLLKPGGYIQWADADTNSDEYVGLADNNLTKEGSSLRKLRGALLAMNYRLAATWPMQLPEIFQQQGLTDVAFDKRTASLGDRRFMLFNAQIFLATVSDVLPNLPDGERKNNLTLLIIEADEECRRGIAWTPDTVVVIGRKLL